MSAKITGGKQIEVATAMPLSVPDHALEQLLGKLYELAVSGDVRAAKLYLDYSLRRDVNEQTGLSLEDVLKLINDQTTTSDPDHAS